MATKKKVKKVKEPAKPVLEGWKLEFARRLKWDRKIQYMALEFILLALGLRGDNDEEVTYARDVLSNIKKL